MNKVKISRAFLRNCEGFMFEEELLDKIDTYLKPDHKYGMTLKGLTNVSPRDFTATLGDGSPIFTRSEVNKIIKLLGYFDLTLKDMVRHDYDNRGNKVEGYNNLDYEELEYDSPPASPEIEKAAEKVLEDLKDFEPTTSTN
tara:strand:+ start:226 stop:648 length:423 start_codon:yes stop_codon:yes gene_type:complete